VGTVATCSLYPPSILYEGGRSCGDCGDMPRHRSRLVHVETDEGRPCYGAKLAPRGDPITVGTPHGAPLVSLDHAAAMVIWSPLATATTARCVYVRACVRARVRTCSWPCVCARVCSASPCLATTYHAECWFDRVHDTHAHEHAHTNTRTHAHAHAHTYTRT
jgi:hypothetical protein